MTYGGYDMNNILGGILGNDSLIGRFLGKIGDIIYLNILFVIFSIPVITLGASYTAMEYTFMKQLREADTPIFKTFIGSFKSNFKQSTLSWIIVIVLGLIVSVDISAFSEGSALASTPLYYFFILLGVILGFVSIYIFPVIGSFKNSLKNLWVQSFFLAAKNVPFTLLMCLIIIVPLVFTNYSGAYFIFFASLWLVFGFGLIGYIFSFIFMRIFKPYL
jgi:uncharacterized membrane protein YesL